ncbi:glycosyltransferase [Roseovarius sp. MMSF_3305]|uniref:glycosyltransferase n=1 Tax=Roseovarius sp. MMSF_3305 TaxID=3046697 RepID=UPI00273E9755|nr:glycosyltransferase [Roseovarius sp. MMSF_3305]
MIVPARNEAATIARVIETMSAMPLVDEVVVVDNGSTDDTADVARAAGGRVVTEARPGMGHAIRAGFIAARNDWVMKVDADLDRFDTSLFSRMIAARAPGVGLIKGQWQDPRDAMPMTRYLVMPALRQMFPALGGLNAPNSGIYAFDRSLIALPEIIGDYAADIDVMLRVHAAGAEVTEVDIGRLDNNPRDGAHYSAMSDTIMAFFLRQRDLQITREIVVLAETAAQVATGCLGTVASHARAGGRVSIFLDRADDAEAAALRAALEMLPTVHIESLAGVIPFRPAPTASGIRLIAPEAAVDGKPLQSALQMLADRVEAEMRQLLLMADTPDTTLKADMGVDIARGAQIKTDLLQELGVPAPDDPMREVFRVRPL